MSRIGRKPILIFDGVSIALNINMLTVTGPQGTLRLTVPNMIQTTVEGNTVKLYSQKNDRKTKATIGLYRTLINNMVIGVHQGFLKRLAIHGVGYRAQTDSKNLILNVGYSHSVTIIPPENINLKVLNNTEISVFGIDKALVGQVAAKIRAVRPPEPYKGKGIRYQGEQVKQKAGKTGK